MLMFEHEFDLKDISDLVKHKGDESTPGSSGGGLKCVGYQTDLILFSCDVVVDDKVVTKLGYYCLKEKVVVDLYVHQEVMDVLVASINPDRNLLGKTVSNVSSVFIVKA